MVFPFERIAKSRIALTGISGDLSASSGEDMSCPGDWTPLRNI